MSRKLLTTEQDTYLRQIAEGRSVKECTVMINEKFGTSFTVAQIRSYKGNHSIISGKKPWEFVNHEQTRLLTTEQHKWLIENSEGVSNGDLTDRFNQTYGTVLTVNQIISYKCNHGISSGLTGHFQKGHVPRNKGKKMSAEQYEKACHTMFKKGNVPGNRVPIGTEKEKADGYVWVKVQDGQLNRNWKLKHVVIWEKEHCPLPIGKVVTFLDGNVRNFDIDNLAAVSKAVNARLNQNHLRYKEKELTEAGIAVAELITAAAAAKNRMK